VSNRSFSVSIPVFANARDGSPLEASGAPLAAVTPVVDAVEVLVCEPDGVVVVVVGAGVDEMKVP
jgi:hypothetical protein